MARLYIWKGASGREIMKGVSPQFAMTKMDLEAHPEFDVYVEDNVALQMIREILAVHDADLVSRCLIVAYGAASVGQSLGQMAKANRFPRATAVFLDGDQEPASGCMRLPGDDAPERVVFEALQAAAWDGLSARVGRSHSLVADACQTAMTAPDHHDWIRLAADELTLGGDMLWGSMCSVWSKACLKPETGKSVADYIRLTQT